MIAMLSGILARAEGELVIVDCQGVGYAVRVPSSTRFVLPRVGESVCLFTYLQVREDAMQLFGFLNWEDKEAFEALLTVSGIGPKLALAILSALPARDLVLAVAAGDTALLASVQGVGKKTAQRMVLELKEKMGAKAAESSLGGSTPALPGVMPGADSTMDAVTALMVLGYTATEAGRAVKLALDSGFVDVPDLIREALKRVG